MHLVDTLTSDYIFEGSLTMISDTNQCMIDLDLYPGSHSFRVEMLSFGGPSALSEVITIDSCLDETISIKGP